jgi:hypothetical protein
VFDGDGSEVLELQAYKIAQNAILYKGSAPCPTCGVIMNPTEYLYSTLGVCPPCGEKRKEARIKRKMAM